MKKVVLIGGYPKGYPIPFHTKTRSGKILRQMFAEIGIDPQLFNLWKNGEEEKAGKLVKKIRAELCNFIGAGIGIIALGRYQYNILKKHNFECGYLPHPASRRKIDRQKLKDGLQKLK